MVADLVNHFSTFTLYKTSHGVFIVFNNICFPSTREKAEDGRNSVKYRLNINNDKEEKL